MTWFSYLRDNCLQNHNLERLIVCFMIGNFVLSTLKQRSTYANDIFMPRHQKVAGYYVIPSEILSVRPSVCLSVRPSIRPSVRPSVRQRPPPFLYRQLLLQF